MAKYKVRHPFRDVNNGKRYQRNEEIELAKERGDGLVTRGLVQAIQPKRQESVETAEAKSKPETAAKRTKAE